MTRFTPSQLMRMQRTASVVARPCDACRGYRLERQWCERCDGAGFIKSYALSYAPVETDTARRTQEKQA